MNWLEDQIFRIQTESEFESIALKVFDYQMAHCATYREYVQILNRPAPKTVSEIPFLPIQFFKSHRILSDESDVQVEFKSSGTGGERSSHYVGSTALYERSFETCYRSLIGGPEDQVILALLPNYQEQGNSSLVYMVDRLIALSNHTLSGFLLHHPEDIQTRYNEALAQGKKIVLFGVSYALMDLCGPSANFSEAIIIETGGMKGRRKEMTKDQLHRYLQEGLKCPAISSEYGMTELLSQGYSLKDGHFTTPPWMRVRIRETNDPFSWAADGKTGGINVIDLANLYSCSFIATQDLGRMTPNGFVITGRFDQSDIRGCNLLVE